MIDDGLYHYEEDLWHDDDDEPEPWVAVYSTINRPLFKFRIQIEFKVQIKLKLKTWVQFDYNTVTKKIENLPRFCFSLMYTIRGPTGVYYIGPRQIFKQLVN